MEQENRIKTLLLRKVYNLDFPDYDDIYANPQDIFLIGIVDQVSLQRLSKEIWKIKPNKKKLYRCFTTFFNSPIYKAALEWQGGVSTVNGQASVITKALRTFKAMNQTDIIDLWSKPTIPSTMLCVLVIMKQALLQKTLLQELVIMLLFRPSLMQDLAMREKSEQYQETVKYLDTIEVNWFFGTLKLSRTSLTEFHDKFKEEQELYAFFMNAVKKELGLGRNATEEEIVGYLQTSDIAKVAQAIVEEMKKDQARAQHYVDRFRKFLEANLSDDLKQSLKDNPITAGLMKIVL